MKLSEMIPRVDKSPSNAAEPNFGEFCAECGVPYESDWSEDFNERVRGYYLQKWLCTDTHVGLIVWFMDDVPIAISKQAGRKCGREYEFLNTEVFDAVRAFCAALAEPEPPVPTIFTDVELPPFYAVAFASQVLVKRGAYLDRPCEVIDKIGETLLVRFDDPDIPDKMINVRDFCIPWSIV